MISINYDLFPELLLKVFSENYVMEEKIDFPENVKLKEICFI